MPGNPPQYAPAMVRSFIALLFHFALQTVVRQNGRGKATILYLKSYSIKLIKENLKLQLNHVCKIYLHT